MTKSEQEEVDKELDILRGTTRLVRNTGRKKVEEIGVGDWCPSPPGLNDNPGTPESGGTSSGSFQSSMSTPHQYQTPVDCPNFVQHHGPPPTSNAFFTSDTFDIGIPNQADPNVAGFNPNQPLSANIGDQDLASLLSHIYSNSPMKPNTEMEGLSSFNGPLQGQASQTGAYSTSGTEMQGIAVDGGERMWAGLPESILNPQFPLGDSAPVSSQNNNWFSKVLTGNALDQLPPMTDGNSTMPSNDPQWSAGNELGLGGVSETVIDSNPDAAQFLADWRMQASFSEGSQVLPNADTEIDMNFFQ